MPEGCWAEVAHGAGAGGTDARMHRWHPCLRPDTCCARVTSPTLATPTRSGLRTWPERPGSRGPISAGPFKRRSASRRISTCSPAGWSGPPLCCAAPTAPWLTSASWSASGAWVRSPRVSSGCSPCRLRPTGQPTRRHRISPGFRPASCVRTRAPRTARFEKTGEAVVRRVTTTATSTHRANAGRQR